MRYAVVGFAALFGISIVLAQLPEHDFNSGTKEKNSFLPISHAMNREVQAVCGQTKFNSSPKSFKISNGDVAAPKQFPWVVALEGKWGVSSCTGSLISQRHVVIAAHCVHNYKNLSLPCIPEETGENINFKNYRIAYGGVCSKRGENCPKRRDLKTVKIKEIVYLTDFNKNKCVKGDDLAIIELAQDLIFNDYVKPICVDNVNLTNMYGFVTAGFGRFTNNTPNVVLRYMRSAVGKLDDPKLIYSRSVFLDKSQKIPSTCHGDSGGPLQGQCLKNGRAYLLGTVSHGSGCNGEQYYHTYNTYIPYYLEFICQMTGACTVDN